MRNGIIIFLGLSIFIFLMPAFITRPFNIVARNEGGSDKPDKKEDDKVKEVELKKYNYKEHSTIKLLHKETNEIEELPLDQYLLGVVSAEMPASFEMEALNAQAVVARTYTLYSISHNQGKHEGADICDNSACCQAWISKENRLEKWDEENRNEYWNKIVNAVNNTEGKIITYNGEVIDAFFHSNSGGKTEVPVNVWGGTNYPYLQSVQTSGEDAYSQYNSELTISKNEFISKIKEKHKDFKINFDEEDSIKILEYTDSERIKTIKVGNINISGVEMRTLMGLKSANFNIVIEGDNIKFTVIGYGHGVGMSQTGADSMAKQGSNYEEIIKHFYTDVEITTI